MKTRSVIVWTLGGAVFGAFFGAVASIFKGGPELMTGVQETWWWFALAGFLTSTIGSPSEDAGQS